MENQIKSQTKKIAEHLMSGKSITPIEALNKFGCFRLGARIHDLKHKQGFCIEAKTVENEGKRFAEYSLTQTP
jgi:hypothetical protein